MDSNSYNPTSKFVDLLTSQQQSVFGFGEDSVELSSSHVPYFGTQVQEASNFTEESPAARRERRTWTPIDDLVLISVWLNTSKDHVVGNEQRCGTFWKRIAAYFAASPKVAGSEHREPSNCKQRWQKINDTVNKFCGAFEAASREKSSGQNETDVLKLAHEIFYNNHQKKNSTLSMLGRSCVMIKNGVSSLLQKQKEALNGGSVMMVQIHQPLAQQK